MAEKRAATLAQLLNNEYGLDVHPGRDTGVVSVLTTVTSVLPNNPNRVGLSFHNLGSTNIYLYLENNPSANQGILIAGGGGVVAFDWRVDMSLISHEWYAIAPSGATNLQVVETVTL